MASVDLLSTDDMPQPNRMLPYSGASLSLQLEALKVLELKNVTVKNGKFVHVFFTPTVPHCSASTLIGLCIRVRLHRALPAHFKVDVEITPGTHLQEVQVNKQLADKERVAAALENENLLEVVHKCLVGAPNEE